MIPPGEARDPEPRGRLFWPAVFIGGGVMAFGVSGALSEAKYTVPTDFVRWFLGAALAHDLILAPLVAMVGVGLVRFLPPGLRRFIQAGLVISALVTLFALPFVLGLGKRVDNPSALPGDYGEGLLWTLTAVWLGVGAVALGAGARSQRLVRMERTEQDG
jgi:hypothetical protein